MADYAFLTVLKPDMSHQTALRQHRSTITQDSTDPAAAQHTLGRNRTGEADSSPRKMRCHSVDRAAHLRAKLPASRPGNLRGSDAPGAPRHQPVKRQTGKREASGQQTEDRFHELPPICRGSVADNPQEPDPLAPM